ncbi:EscR/YscR/HrcR family type III secretion system export apparatus protein [Xenophilus aerolatus]|nr:EscR/YscR/HrcR family type III secretion system export apparatus protein [Xenophilus aerolatus]
MTTEFDPIGLALMLGALSLLPAVLLSTTCFLKISIVLVVVRNAIGVQQVPPSVALYSVALAATLAVMAPTFLQMSEAWPAASAASAGATGKPPKFGVPEAKAAFEPLRKFMERNTSPDQRERFVRLVKRQWPKDMADKLEEHSWVALVPAFIVSELQVAFEIGFLLYVPFVVIDLLISNLLLALGMQMVSPMTISLPLKLLLFVMLDGWGRLIEGLVQSYL